MAQIIKFYDENHEYELNGEKIPSVSELCRFASREIYGDISQYTLDNAAERGKKVHRCTEELDKYGETSVEESIAPYIAAYLKFREEHKPTYTAIEKVYASVLMRFAGTLDRVATLATADGVCIIDIKSSSVVQKVLAKIQLNGYKKVYEETTEQEVSHLFILHLKNDGTYKLIPIEIDPSLFDACYTLHKALEKKKRGKKNG
jgi:CRISPR/Cas system-associated exonuclease Cas4 (RecB family)